jgi:hypothetical protein
MEISRDVCGGWMAATLRFLVPDLGTRSHLRNCPSVRYTLLINDAIKHLFALLQFKYSHLARWNMVKCELGVYFSNALYSNSGHSGTSVARRWVANLRKAGYIVHASPSQEWTNPVGGKYIHNGVDLTSILLVVSTFQTTSSGFQSNLTTLRGSYEIVSPFSWSRLSNYGVTMPTTSTIYGNGRLNRSLLYPPQK